MDNLLLDYIEARAKAGLAADRKGLAFCRAIRSARVLGGDYKQIRPYLRNCVMERDLPTFRNININISVRPYVPRTRTKGSLRRGESEFSQAVLEFSTRVLTRSNSNGSPGLPESGNRARSASLFVPRERHP